MKRWRKKREKQMDTDSDSDDDNNEMKKSISRRAMLKIPMVRYSTRNASRERLERRGFQKGIQREPLHTWKRKAHQSTAQYNSPGQQQIPMPLQLLQQPVTLLVVGQVNSFGNMWLTPGTMQQQFPQAEQLTQHETSLYENEVAATAFEIQANEYASTSERQQSDIQWTIISEK